MLRNKRRPSVRASNSLLPSISSDPSDLEPEEVSFRVLALTCPKETELEAKMSTTHITALIQNKRILAKKVNLKVS